MAIDYDYQIEFTTLVDITDGEGENTRIIRKNVRAKMSLFRSEISGFMDMLSRDGGILKSKCLLLTKQKGNFYIIGSRIDWTHKLDLLSTMYAGKKIGFEIPKKQSKRK